MLHIADHLIQRKLSLNMAAKKTGMDEARLRAVSEGAEPSLGELRQIAKALKLPLSALLNRAESNPVQMLFRKNVQRIESSPELIAEELLSSYINGIHNLVSQHSSNLKWLTVFRDVQPIPANAEQFAKHFRDVFFNGALDPLQELPQLVADKLGVFLVQISNQETEGASAILGQHAFILLSRRTFKPRMLFTLAHEVGHLVAHGAKGGTEEFALFDKAKTVGSFHRQQRAEEQFADAFASSLLMPKPIVFMFLDNVRKRYNLSGPLGDIEINLVARFFGVSFEVAGRRCEDLELLPSGGAFALYDQLIKTHVNPEQRASAAGLPEREEMHFDISPALLEIGAEKIQAGEFSIGKVAEILHLPLSRLVASNAKGGE